MCNKKCKDCQCDKVVLDFNGITVTTEKPSGQPVQKAATNLYRRINNQAAQK